MEFSGDQPDSAAFRGVCLQRVFLWPASFTIVTFPCDRKSTFTLGHFRTLSGVSLARITRAQDVRATKLRDEPGIRWIDSK